MAAGYFQLLPADQKRVRDGSGGTPGRRLALCAGDAVGYIEPSRRSWLSGAPGDSGRVGEEQHSIEGGARNAKALSTRAGRRKHRFSFQPDRERSPATAAKR